MTFSCFKTIKTFSILTNMFLYFLLQLYTNELTQSGLSGGFLPLQDRLQDLSQLDLKLQTKKNFNVVVLTLLFFIQSSDSKFPQLIVFQQFSLLGRTHLYILYLDQDNHLDLAVGQQKIARHTPETLDVTWRTGRLQITKKRENTQSLLDVALFVFYKCKLSEPLLLYCCTFCLLQMQTF